MQHSIDILLAFFLASNLMLVVASRLLHCIQFAALQGFLLGVLPLLALSSGVPHAELWVTVVLTLGMKAFLLPFLLRRALYRAKIPREVEPFVGYSLSLVLLLCIMMLSFWGVRFVTFPERILSPLAFPAACVTVYTGLFLVISRRKALTQAIGFLIFENGITLFGMGMMIRHCFIVELGILLDVFVLLFVMGITLFHIRHEFRHIDADKLTQLGDVQTPSDLPEESR